MLQCFRGFNPLLNDDLSILHSLLIRCAICRTSWQFRHFNDEGLIESAHFDARGAMVGNRIVPMPWEGRWSNYQVHGGIRVPMTGEAAWLPAAGRRPYFRGSVTALRHFIAA